MKCPRCRKPTLFRKDTDDTLDMKCCSDCGGHWLSSASYWSWLESARRTSNEALYSDINCDAEDSLNAKLCPDCGRLLTQFKVGHGINFRLDHCNSCNGVWFDKNEWELLCRCNLQEELHKIFTTAWQNKIKEEEKHAWFDSSYRARFGADYDKLKEFKSWLETHQLKTTILAFLADPAPYK